MTLRTLPLLLALLCGALPPGCSPEPAAPAWPAGTVLAVDGEPVSGAEVDRLAAAVQPLHPPFTLPQRRRMVLLNVLFPLALGRAQAPERRREAQAEAAAFHARAVAGALEPDELPPRVEESWARLGTDCWLAIGALPEGRWSEPFELAGAFAVARIEARRGAQFTAAERVELEIAYFPYVADRSLLPQQVLEARLDVVDPAWEEVVPANWRLAMRAEAR